MSGVDDIERAIRRLRAVADALERGDGEAPLGVSWYCYDHGEYDEWDVPSGVKGDAQKALDHEHACAQVHRTWTSDAGEVQWGMLVPMQRAEQVGSEETAFELVDCPVTDNV